MAYPPSSQRPPPVRQYAPSPASAAAPYAQGDMYGAGDYPPDPGSEDPAYGYQPGPPGPPRSLRLVKCTALHAPARAIRFGPTYGVPQMVVVMPATDLPRKSVEDHLVSQPRAITQIT
ncbi:hypothetical protein N7533_003273 [Penicillium manginii]|uniref:uncharacterized protein n=1 Tax=Penicillium manginii TaxID=203109 RepID=UPI00254915C9|nr:uncharacterized protein N7533_003273 [Penicillium manginii]KAJ5764592.1 hypothetical protein N7533_003273 [Penicillium manginii]